MPMPTNKYDVRAKRKELETKIQRREWSSFDVQFRQILDRSAELCRSVAECRDHRGRTLLHALCDVKSVREITEADRRGGFPGEHFPLSSAVRLTAEASPESLLRRCPPHERTPLHVATDRGHPREVVEALVGAADADADAGRRSLATRDAGGSTPLLLAVRGRDTDRLDEELVRYLVRSDASRTSLLPAEEEGGYGGKKRGRKKNWRGDAPLKHVAAAESLWLGHEGPDDFPDLLAFMIKETYKAKMMTNTFLTESRRRENGEEEVDICLLQATIVCFHMLGKHAHAILQFVVRYRGGFNRERLASERDALGNLALHVACSAETKTFDRTLRLGERDTDYGIDGADANLVDHLVATCPEALEVRNDEGDLPLHLAIRGGTNAGHVRAMLDARPETSRMRDGRGEVPLHAALKFSAQRGAGTCDALLGRYRGAGRAVDGRTGLYPFQIAACCGLREGEALPSGGKTTQTRKHILVKDEELMLASMSLSFRLLREYPEVIRLFCGGLD